MSGSSPSASLTNIPDSASVSAKKPRCGIIASARDYFVSYIQWALEEEARGLFEFVGIHTDDMGCYASVTDKFVNTLDEIVATSDLLISLGYWRILSREVIEKIPLGIVNVHHSHKLRYRGRHCTTWAIRNGDSVHGSTLHYINEKLDDGPIIDSDCCDITVTDTAQTLFLRANDIGLALLKKNIKKILSGTVVNNIAADEQHWTHRERELSVEIDAGCLTNPDEFSKLVRSVTFHGKPIPYICIGGKKIFLVLEGTS